MATYTAVLLMAAFIEEVVPSTLEITEVGGAGMLHSISSGQ